MAAKRGWTTVVIRCPHNRGNVHGNAKLQPLAHSTPPHAMGGERQPGRPHVRQLLRVHCPRTRVPSGVIPEGVQRRRGTA